MKVISPLILSIGIGLITGEVPPKPAVTSLDGKVVSVVDCHQGRDGRLVLSDLSGKSRQPLAVPAAADITLNRQSARLSDLAAGDRVAVAIDESHRATEIVATREKTRRVGIRVH